jgi:hypothetical protein
MNAFVKQDACLPVAFACHPREVFGGKVAVGGKMRFKEQG